MKNELEKIMNEIIAMQFSKNEDVQEIVEIYEAIVEFRQNLERRSDEVYDSMLDGQNDNDDVEFEKAHNK